MNFFKRNALASAEVLEKNKISDSTATNHYVTNPDIVRRQKELAENYPVKFIQSYLNSESINRAIKLNPMIKRIMESNNLSISYNLENVNSIIMSHLIPTSKTAGRIYKGMGHKESEENFSCLIQAALLHDIGKIFIPEGILNKRGKLNSKEMQIVELHNRLSFEILKTTDLNPLVAKLALEHHNYDNKLVQTQENQALTIADVYCALRETRSYKKAMSDVCARMILYDMGTKGKFDTRYINYINS